MLHLTPFRYLLSSFLNITLHNKPIRKFLLFHWLIGSVWLMAMRRFHRMQKLGIRRFRPSSWSNMRKLHAGTLAASGTDWDSADNTGLHMW